LLVVRHLIEDIHVRLDCLRWRSLASIENRDRCANSSGGRSLLISDDLFEGFKRLWRSFFCCGFDVGNNRFPYGLCRFIGRFLWSAFANGNLVPRLEAC
jgi:hypothetical protein